METLRDKALREVSREDSVLSEVGGVISASFVLDATEVFTYFLEGTPEEDPFSVTDVPLDAGLRWLAKSRDRTGGVFMETEAPPNYGLGWGTLLTGSAGRGAAESISRAGSLLGVDTEVSAGDPGLALCDPGLVCRAGTLLFFDRPLADDKRREFYGQLLGGRVELEDLRGVLQMGWFVELADADDPAERSVITPSVLWYLPVAEDGYVAELDAVRDEMMMLAPGVGDLDELEEVMDFMGEAQRPLCLAALFALSCAGSAAYVAGPSGARAERVDDDGVGPVEVLRLGGLVRTLETQGGAARLGLAHALTVCREEFGEY